MADIDGNGLVPVASICSDYRPTVRRIAQILHRRYYIPGHDFADILGLVNLALLQAIRDFDPSKGTFERFIYLIAQRLVITGIRTESRKSRVLNTAYSLDALLGVDGDSTLLDLIQATDSVEDSSLSEHEPSDNVLTFISRYCTPIEQLVARGIANQKSYDEMVEQAKTEGICLNSGRQINRKSIDNAFSRLKQKVRKEFPTASQ